MTENLLLTHLSTLRSDLKSMRAEMRDGFADLKTRMSDLETAVVSVKRDVNHGDPVDARLQVSLDKITEGVRLIEQRLDRVEAP